EPMTRALLLSCFTVVCFMGCGPASHSHPAAPQHVVVTPVAPSGASATPTEDNPLARSTQPFGGDRHGFVEATSGNGRYVALRRFAGSDEPEFGHHGEVVGGADLVLVDLTNLAERPFAEIID